MVVSPFPPFPHALLFSPSLKPPPLPPLLRTNERKRSQKSAASGSFFSPTLTTNIFFLSGGGSDASSNSGSIFLSPEGLGGKGFVLRIAFSSLQQKLFCAFSGARGEGGVYSIYVGQRLSGIFSSQKDHWSALERK